MLIRDLKFIYSLHTPSSINKTAEIFRNILVFIFLIGFSNTAYSQKNTKKIDSINNLIEKSYIYGDIDQKDAFKLTTELYYLSREDKFVKGQLTAVFEELKIYYLHGDADRALSKISEGISLAKSIRDYNMLCRFLLIYQNLLLELDYLNESKHNITKCEEFNKLVNDTEDQRINAVHILLSHADLIADEARLTPRHLDSILSFKKRAYNEALKIGNSNNLKNYVLINALESLTMSTIQTGDAAQSRKYTSRLNQLLAAYPNKNLLLQNLIIKGAVENSEHDYLEAIKYFSEVISATDNIYILNEVYPMISISYGGLKDFENAAAYSWKNKQLTDSIGGNKKKSGDAEVIHEINLKIFDKKQQNDISTDRTIFIAVIIPALLIPAYLFYIRSRRIKNNTSSISFIPNNETAYDIKHSAASGDEELETTRKLVNLIKENIRIFYLEFQKAYPFFYPQLQDTYPQLNISDINFCSLIKMNLGIKEIAVHTNSSVKSAESRRYRIIKKMQINNQKELYFIISTLKPN
jgi:hypothetical protein